MREVTPRGPEFRWPLLWEGIGRDWTFDCRERRPVNVLSDAALAAAHDLTETLATMPTVYWLRPAAERELSTQFNISVSAARALLRDAAGSTLLEGGTVWCSLPGAAGWPDYKRRVFAALPGDALRTFDEVATAADEKHLASLHAALYVLCTQRAAACVQDSPNDGGPYFCKAWPGGAWAGYEDLCAQRMGKAPEPAA